MTEAFLFDVSRPIFSIISHAMITELNKFHIDFRMAVNVVRICFRKM